MPHAPRSPIVRLVIAAGLASTAAAWSHAQLDNNVQWNGVSHVGWTDRRPRVPRNGEAFVVKFQTYKDDVSAARVRIDTGSVSFVNAAKVGNRGPYDLWEATIPATASTTESYILEITDGTDTDYYSAAGMSDALNTSNPFSLNFTTLEHAPVGATPVTGGTVFRVWAPTPTAAQVRGTFNAWGSSNPMTKVGEHFIAYVAGASAGAQYKYYFNNSTWATDPRSAAVVPTASYNSVIVNQDAYVWQNPTFSPRPMEELVIYQLHVGTFAGRNDPKGSTPNPSRYIDVTARADHLADLGVNAVMLNPINEFPGDFSGGYNSISPWTVESKLGTPDQFKQMVDALHQRGIAVLLDVVWNHVSPSDNFLWNFGGSQLYFDATAVNTPWGAQADFEKTGVQDFYVQSAEQLLTDYRLDGFRVDATHYMTDSGLTPQWSAGQTIIRGLNNLKTSRHADAHTIAEIYIDNKWVTDPTTIGLGFDAQYQNEFKEALRSAVFAAASGSPNITRVANVLDGQGTGVQGENVFNYFELHDDCWPSNGGSRAVAQIDTTAPSDDQFARGRTKVAQALVLLSRGVPAIVQGTEFLESDGWESTRLDWSKKTTYASIFKFYQDLIALRTTQPELFANSSIWTYHINEAQDVMAFQRYLSDGGSFVAVVNLSNTDRNNYRIGLPRTGRWGVVLNSNETQYGGPGGGSSGPVTLEAIAGSPFPQSVVLDIPARTILLIQHQPPGLCMADVNNDTQIDLADFFQFLNDFDQTLPAADINGDLSVDLGDFFDFLTAFDQGC
jgi:1,4-alpha-glucan branching enzyme